MISSAGQSGCSAAVVAMRASWTQELDQLVGKNMAPQTMAYSCSLKPLFGSTRNDPAGQAPRSVALDHVGYTSVPGGVSEGFWGAVADGAEISRSPVKSSLYRRRTCSGNTVAKLTFL